MGSDHLQTGSRIWNSCCTFASWTTRRKPKMKFSASTTVKLSADRVRLVFLFHCRLFLWIATPRNGWKHFKQQIKISVKELVERGSCKIKIGPRDGISRILVRIAALDKHALLSLNALHPINLLKQPKQNPTCKPQ